MPVAALAWLFLEAMRIPRSVWPLLFSNFSGQLPTDDDQLQAMMVAIRQQGHITEHTHAGPRDLYEGMRGGTGRGHYLTEEGQGNEGWGTEWPDSSEYYHGTAGASHDDRWGDMPDMVPESYVSEDE